MMPESSGRLVSDYCRQPPLGRIDDVDRRSFIGLSDTAARRKGRDRKRTVGVTAPQPPAGAAHRRSGDRLGAAPHWPSDWSSLSAEHALGRLGCGRCTGCMTLPSPRRRGKPRVWSSAAPIPCTGRSPRHRRVLTRTAWVAHDLADCSVRSRAYSRTAVLSGVDGCAACLSSPDGPPAFTHEAVSPSRGPLGEYEQLGQRIITDLVET